MNRKVIERRIDLARKMILSDSITSVAPIIAKDHNCSIYAVKADWTRRNNWYDSVMRIYDPTLEAEILATLKEIKARAMMEYLKAVDVKAPLQRDGQPVHDASGKTIEELVVNNASNRLGALRTAEAAMMHIAQILMDTGKIKKVPLEFEEVSHTKINMESLSPEQREDIRRITRIAAANRVSTKRSDLLH